VKAELRKDFKGIYNDFVSNIHDEVNIGQDVDFSTYPYDCTGCTRMNFCTHIGSGFWEFVRISQDVLVCIAKNNFNSDYKISYLVGRDHYVFRFLISGEIAISYDGQEKIRIPEQKISMFRALQGSRMDLSHGRGSQFTGISLYISTAYMDKLCQMLSMEHRNNFYSLLKGQGRGSSGGIFDDISLTPHIKSQILDIHANHYSGALRRFFIKAKTNELLCSIMQRFSKDAVYVKKDGFGESEKIKLREAFEILEENFSEPPSIKEISKQVGLNRTKLRKGFLALYGKTIFDHCLDRRMQEACELLRSKSLNITQISQGLGYAHATNFTASFKKYFGVLPKDYRKSAL